MAYVEWRGGRWKVQVRGNGAKKWEDLPSEIRQDQPELAKAVGDGMASAIRSGKSVPSVRGETVRDWFGRWFKWREKRGDGDIAKLRSRFERYVATEIGALPMMSVRREHLKQIVVKLDELVANDTLAWKTAGNVWSQVVSRAFKDASNGKEPSLCILTENPAVGIQPPDKGARVKKQYLHPTEFLLLVECPDVPLWRRRLYAFAVYTYMRAGEIAALRWEDVDVDRGIILVHQSVDRNVGKLKSTKTDEARRVVVELALRPMLAAMHDERRGDLVFDRMPPAHGKDGQAPTLRADLERAEVKRTALVRRSTVRTRKWLTFHDLRASGITWAAIRGDDPLKIMSRSGHTEYSTMLMYVREAEVVRDDFGEVFPALPEELGVAPQKRPNAPKRTPQMPTNQRPQGDSKAGGNRDERPGKRAFGRHERTASAPNDAVRRGAEDDLAAAVLLAAKAKRWDIVAQLTRQIDALEKRRAGEPTGLHVVAGKGRTA